MRRAVIVVAVAALLATGLNGCAPAFPDAPPQNSVHVGQGDPVSLDTGSGLVVSIPGDAISGSGELVVTPQTLGELQGWKIELTGGAKLVGSATLRFPHELAPGEPAPVIISGESSSGEFTPAAVSLDAGGATVSTDHFSFWLVDWWNDILTKVTALWSAIFSPGGDGTSPTCTGETAIRRSLAVTSDNDDRVLWCLGSSQDNRPQLKVVNGRSYAMTVDETDHMVLTNPDDSWQSLLPQLMTTLGYHPAAGHSMHLLMGGAGYTYADASPASAEELRLEASPPAYVASVLQFAVETVVHLGSIFGKSLATSAVVHAYDATGCIEGFGKLANADVTHAGQLGDYLTTALKTVTSCMGDVIKSLLGRDGLVLSVILSGLAWLLSGVENLRAGSTAIADLLSHTGAYRITVSPNGGTGSAGASSLLTVTAPPMCQRPAGALVDGQLPVADPNMNGYTMLVMSNGVPFSATGSVSFSPGTITAAVFNCSAGGVDWPDVIGFYDSSLSPLGYLDFANVDQQEHSSIESMTFVGGTLQVSWVTNDSCHTGADVSVPRTGVIRFSTDGTPAMTAIQTGKSTNPNCMGQ